ncbi:helix-turn-helix domain-containing protein [Jatrophihabitans fulvus]
MDDTLTDRIAHTVAQARRDAGLSAAALAERSGVSRAMIAKVEQGRAQPTAVLLGRLSGALGLSLSQLLARAEGGTGTLARAAEQPRWTDPETGYVRRSVSPEPGGPLELVEIELPPHAEVPFPAASYALAHHQIWVLAGRLDFREGATTHELAAGDCLRLGAPQPCVYANPGPDACRYLVVLARR